MLKGNDLDFVKMKKINYPLIRNSVAVISSEI